MGIGIRNNQITKDLNYELFKVQHSDGKMFDIQLALGLHTIQQSDCFQPFERRTYCYSDPRCMLLSIVTFNLMIEQVSLKICQG